jgi:hypothetical protein
MARKGRSLAGTAFRNRAIGLGGQNQGMSIVGLGAERRAFGRRPTHIHGMVYTRGFRPIRCIVTDISEGGARLELSEAFRLPPNFRLMWEGSGMETMCEVRHQSDAMVGAMFLDGKGAEIVKYVLGAAQVN